MASEFKASSLDYGVVIAFVAPGFVALQAISYHVGTARAWMDAASTKEQSVGVFLFVLLGSLSAGVIISGIRSLVIDRLLCSKRLGPFAVPGFRLDWSKVDEKKLPVLLTIRDGYYRYYQFYSNTLVALVLWAWSRATVSGPSFRWYHWVLIVATLAALLVSARGSWKRYVEAVQQAFDSQRRECHEQ